MAEIALYLVATPIGNLGDMVPRAVQCLQSVDLIAAEDTRRTAVLCRHFAIRTRLCAYHEHNEVTRARRLCGLMAAGKKIALVADAGTPLIADPGYRLAAAARAAGLGVSVIPGPCALVAALAGAGLPSDRFLFVGFPPARAAARAEWFADLGAERGTLVCYESSHRILSTLAMLVEVFGGERRVCLARELTKLHESWLHGTLEQVWRAVAADPNQCRGEHVLVISGADRQAVPEPEIARHMRLLMAELPTAKAATIAARLLGVSRRECYRLGVELAKG
ncbi:MAG: 16S rRNA (cytidine(1402)-2'-O)-methyltransferase [Cellvibrionales bacterium]|nr:16S rRNA (cytidine(1402)-2'-O)-methyltransferase [Cellvibrionales bacterium]